MNVAQSGKIVLNMFQHVQADDGLELPRKFLEVFRLAEIGKTNLHVRAVLKAGGQARQMLWINIGHNVAAGRPHKAAGKISNASANFHDGATEKRLNGISHPSVKTRRG